MDSLEQCRSIFPNYDWIECPAKSPIEQFIGTPIEPGEKVGPVTIEAWGNGTLYQAQIEIRFWSDLHKLHLRSKSHPSIDGALMEIRRMIERSIEGFQSALGATP